MKILNLIALILVIIGAINWLLIGILNFNLVSYLFGINTIVTKVIYILVGICGLWCINIFGKIVEEH